MIRHAPFIRSRLIEGSSGMTPYRRWKGKEFKKPLVEFGERVMCYNQGSKEKTRWSHGGSQVYGSV